MALNLNNEDQVRPEEQASGVQVILTLLLYAFLENVVH